MTPEFQNFREKIIRRHEKGETWAGIARSFESVRITRGHIYKMTISEWEPLDKDLRVILGLPATIPVPACPICGLAHTHSHDEQVYDPALLATYDPATQVVKPAPKPHKPRTPRNYPGKVWLY